jgi:hypothetical protein
MAGKVAVRRRRQGSAASLRQPTPGRPAACVDRRSPTPTPYSTASTTTLTGSTSQARACGAPVNPLERQAALWTCHFAWTTQERFPHAHSNSSKKKRFKPRFQIDHAAWPMPQDRPARTPRPRGEIKSERWARSSRNPWTTSNRYTPATSSESAPRQLRRLAPTPPHRRPVGVPLVERTLSAPSSHRRFRRPARAAAWGESREAFQVLEAVINGHVHPFS